MSNPKKQHYVPQFYLKNFSLKGNKNNIYCYDKRNLKCFRNEIRNLAQEKYFYGAEKQSTEKDLSNIEYETSKVIHKIIKNPNHKILSEDDRLLLSKFMKIQILRTPEFRNQISDTTILLKNILGEEDNEIKKEFDYFLDKINFKKYSISKIYDKRFNKIIRILFCKKWFIIINKTKIGFWTSDNPIVKYNKEYPDNLGLRNYYLNVIFPLSPKICLKLSDPYIFLDKNLMNNRLNKEDCIHNLENIILQTDNIKINRLDEINYFNDLQAKYSNRFVFSSNRDLDKITDLINNNTVVKYGEKKRIESENYNINENESILRLKFKQ